MYIVIYMGIKKLSNNKPFIIIIYLYLKAMFDTSIEVDVENTDMTEKDVGAYIMEEDEDEPRAKQPTMVRLVGYTIHVSHQVIIFWSL